MTAPLKTALIYDFDGTLARGNMQEVTFIPSVGMGIGDFWGEADRLTREADGDNILIEVRDQGAGALDSTSLGRQLTYTFDPLIYAWRRYP